jgi:N-methylhydantoinase B
MAFSTHIAAEGTAPAADQALLKNYEINEDFLAIIMNNTRTPHYIKGDLQAHLGALQKRRVRD